MGDTKIEDEFAGDSAVVLTVSAAGACCGNAVPAVDPAGVAADPCCGTAAGARAVGSCCAPTAKVEAVAAGRGCCG
jgi:hypothetical protein